MLNIHIIVYTIFNTNLETERINIYRSSTKYQSILLQTKHKNLHTLLICLRMYVWLVYRRIYMHRSQYEYHMYHTNFLTQLKVSA